MNILILIRLICRKPPAKMILNSKVNAFHLKLEMARMTALTAFIEYCTRDLRQENKVRKINENNRKEDVQLSLFSYE